MRKVKLTRTVSYDGKMFMRGSEVTLNDEQLRSLGGYYESLDKPVRVDIMPARNAAMRRPARTTEIRQSEPVSRLSFPLKVVNALMAAGIVTIDELKTKSFDELVAIKGIGEVTANNLIKAVNES